MSCHRFASLCLLAGVLPACASPRAAAPIAPVQAAVDSVFTRYYRAIGGLDRVLAVTSRRMWGTYVEGALSAHTYAEGFDGRTWEYNFQMRRLVVDSGVAADAGRGGRNSMSRESATGRLLNTLQWDSVRTNVGVDARQLGRPDTP